MALRKESEKVPMSSADAKNNIGFLHDDMDIKEMKRTRERITVFAMTMCWYCGWKPMNNISRSL